MIFKKTKRAELGAPCSEDMVFMNNKKLYYVQP